MNTVRPFTVAAYAAVAGFAVEGAVTLTHHVGDDHWGTAAQVLNTSFVVGVVASAVGLPYIARWLGVGRTGRVGVAVAQVGCVAMTVESVASGVHGGNILAGVFFAGIVLMTLGLLGVAVSGVQAGVARWAAGLPVAGWVVSIIGGEHGGSLVLAAVWGLFAVAVSRPAATRTVAQRSLV